jgi:invasion protein IalB
LIRLSRAAALCIAAFATCASPGLVHAASKKTEKSGKKEDAKPALVATFGDWNVFVGQSGKGRICYTLAQPKTREPDSLKRDPGYAFISDRPAEGVRNEVSFIMGFDVASGADAEAKTDKTDEKPKKNAKASPKAKAIPAPLAVVGDQDFDLLPKGGNLWVKNAARESALIAEMKKGVTLQIKASSSKGNPSLDTYSLSGFSQAMDRLQKECAGKS